MRKKTYLANAIDIADMTAEYDGEAKKLVSDRTILAWIVKYTVRELRDNTIEEIKAAIEGEPEIAMVPVYPGRRKPDAIVGLPTENKVPNEGTVTFDIRFHVLVPGGERIKILLNIEIQKDYYPGYDLVTRAVFYCARMLSAQLDTEFTAENYDEVKKVYSIWLCLNAPRHTVDTITEYGMAQKKLAGDFRGKARFDLLSAVMVCIDQYSYQRKTTPLHGLLGTLFSTKLTPDEKMALLREEYGIETTVEVEEGMKRMCNLSDVIVEQGLQQGLEQGLQQGLEQGLQQGLEQGLQQGLEQGLQQGIQQGLQQGKEKSSINLVCKKVKRGKSLSVIAEELEEEEESLKVIYEAVLDAAPDYDVDQIYDVLHGTKE